MSATARSLAVLLLTALALAGCGAATTTPPAPPAPISVIAPNPGGLTDAQMDQTFLTVLDRKGITYPSPDYMIQFGRGLARIQREQNAEPVAFAQALSGMTGTHGIPPWTLNECAFIVGAATTAYATTTEGT